MWGAKLVWGVVGLIALAIGLGLNALPTNALTQSAIGVCVLIGLVGLCGFLVIRFRESVRDARRAARDLRAMARGRGNDDRGGSS